MEYLKYKDFVKLERVEELSPFQVVEQLLKSVKLDGPRPTVEYDNVKKVYYMEIWYSKYSMADKAIALLRKNGYDVSDRLSIPSHINAFFKYKIQIYTKTNPLYKI